MGAFFCLAPPACFIILTNFRAALPFLVSLTVSAICSLVDTLHPSCRRLIFLTYCRVLVLIRLNQGRFPRWWLVPDGRGTNTSASRVSTYYNSIASSPTLASNRATPVSTTREANLAPTVRLPSFLACIPVVVI